MNKLVISLKVFSLILFFSLLNIQTSQAVVAVKKLDKKEVVSAEKSASKLTKKKTAFGKTIEKISKEMGKKESEEKKIFWRDY